MEIRDEMRQRRRLERRWRETKLAIDRVNFVKQKEKLKKCRKTQTPTSFNPCDGKLNEFKNAV